MSSVSYGPPPPPPRRRRRRRRRHFRFKGGTGQQVPEVLQRNQGRFSFSLREAPRQ